MEGPTIVEVEDVDVMEVHKRKERLRRVRIKRSNIIHIRKVNNRHTRTKWSQIEYVLGFIQQRFEAGHGVVESLRNGTVKTYI